MKKSFKNIKTLIITSTSIVIVVLFFIFVGGGNGKEEIVTVKKGDLIKTVRVSGKVIANQSVDLAFEVGGTVAYVYKDVGDSVNTGDIIVSLDKASVQANLLKARADLVASQAELSKLNGGLGMVNTNDKVKNVEAETIQEIITAYTVADDTIHNKVDQLFTNPSSPNPEIISSFKGYELRLKINKTRIDIEQTLSLWNSLVSGLGTNQSTENSSNALALSKKYGAFIVLFLNDIATAVNTLESNTTLSQTLIDKYRVDISSARSALNLALSNLVSQSDNVNNVVFDISVQEARVASGQANVASFEAQLRDTTLGAPFSGIISKQNAKKGQAVSQNLVLVSVISRDLKIEAYVPEVSIAGITLGNGANITLDAYGPGDMFETVVSHIDPAETVKDGVSNYKIELVFSIPDARIRPGMTANVSIETLRKPETLMIPLRSILDMNGKKFVFMTNENRDKKEISIGDVDSEGNAEIISGLKEGDTIYLNPIK